ncbi:DUF6461 domain-containing protein [Streptomyces sp. bgisy084]|uniref:DUF6461 domain-containing protein n=1 Tax=Streptomyces sp. bgisy084 TaxID=3413777 RepID=UPI003D72F74D
MTSTAADYVWFEERFPELAEAYCFTLVHGLPPSEVLRRLQGRDEPPRTGAEQIVEAAFGLLDSDDAWPSSLDSPTADGERPSTNS